MFPKTGVQNCIIHRLVESSKFVSDKDIKVLMTDLKAAYAALDERSSLDAMDEFKAEWSRKYPKIASYWREN